MATVPAGVGGSVAGTLVAGGLGATPKMVSAASSVTALRVVTPGGMVSQPSALRVTPVSSGVRSAGVCLMMALLSVMYPADVATLLQQQYAVKAFLHQNAYL